MMGWVDYISHHSFQRAEKVSACNEESKVEKSELNSNTFRSLNQNSAIPAPHLHSILLAEAPIQQMLPTVSTESSSVNTNPLQRLQLHNLFVKIRKDKNWIEGFHPH